MDIAQFLKSLNPFDLLVVLGLMAMFILGFIQGTIRRLLGIASILFSFLVAAQLREPLGDFLFQNWRQFPEQYSRTIGMATVFVAMTIGFTIAIQVFYKVVPLFPKYPVVDELLGGSLGVIQGLIIVGVVILILDPFYQLPGIPKFSGELSVLRSTYEAYTGSVTASIYRENVIPAFIAIAGALLPQAVKDVFPTSSS